MENLEKVKVPSKVNSFLLGLIGIGVISLVAGFLVDAPRAWAGLLVIAYYVMTIGLFGGFFLSLHYLSGTKWSVVIRRIPENMVFLLIIAAVLIAVIMGFGTHHLYEWTHQEVMDNDHILQLKKGYLNIPFMIGRLIFYFAAWIGVAAVFLILFAYLLEFSSMDLVESLEPHWQQTMYPVYAFAGVGYSGFAIMIILTYTIQKFGGLKTVNAEHYHDMGKFLLAFTGFWGYIAFAQHMLMWYANLPEETVYLERRLQGPWFGFTFFLWFGHFALPLVVLLSSSLKRSPKKLAMFCWWIVFMGFVDIVWLVYGGIQEHNVHGFPFKWMETGLFLGAIGIVGYTVLNAFSKVNPEPIGDPLYEESVNFHQKF